MHHEKDRDKQGVERQFDVHKFCKLFKRNIKSTDNSHSHPQLFIIICLSANN